MCMVEMADESYVVHNVAQRVARKPHKCYECHREIAPGEQYEYATGLARSYGWDHYHTCAHCVWARRWLMSECNGFLYGGVYEDLHEHWLEDPLLATLDLGRRIIGMRRRWRNQDGSLMTVPA